MFMHADLVLHCMSVPNRKCATNYKLLKQTPDKQLSCTYNGITSCECRVDQLLRDDVAAQVHDLKHILVQLPLAWHGSSSSGPDGLTRPKSEVSL